MKEASDSCEQMTVDLRSNTRSRDQGEVKGRRNLPDKKNQNRRLSKKLELGARIW